MDAHEFTSVWRFFVFLEGRKFTILLFRTRQICALRGGRSDLICPRRRSFALHSLWGRYNGESLAKLR
jgi:hypothetical protein